MSLRREYLPDDFFVMFSDFKNDIDVAFLLDSSASLSPSDFNKTKTFVVDVVSGFDVALDRVRVALVVYSTQAYPRFFLNTFSTKAAVLLAVQNLTYTPGGTNTRDGLNYIKNNIFTVTVLQCNQSLYQFELEIKA